VCAFSFPHFSSSLRREHLLSAHNFSTRDHLTHSLTLDMFAFGVKGYSRLSLALSLSLTCFNFHLCSANIEVAHLISHNGMRGEKRGLKCFRAHRTQFLNPPAWDLLSIFSRPHAQSNTTKIAIQNISISPKLSLPHTHTHITSMNGKYCSLVFHPLSIQSYLVHNGRIIFSKNGGRRRSTGKAIHKFLAVVHFTEHSLSFNYLSSPLW
jgi:hypothetical protein